MTNQQSKKLPLRYLVFAGLCLIIPASFITLHITTPSDGARLTETDPIFTSLGAVVSPYYPGSTDLREGDVIVEAAGQTMESWAEDLFQVNVKRPEYGYGTTVTYGVLRDGEPVDVSIALGQLPTGSILVNHWGAILFAALSQVVAVFVLIRRPQDPAARALFIWAMSGSHTYAWSFFLQVSDMVGGVGFWLFRLSTPGLWLIYWPAALHMALVFPKPMPIVRRSPMLVPALYGSSFLIYFCMLTFFWFSSINVLDWLGRWAMAESTVAAIFLLGTLIGIIWQYRTSQSWSERVKIRWAIYGASISASLGLIFWIIMPVVVGFTPLNANLLGLLMLLFPVTLAIAVYRYQLFDIDVIIRRTFLYAVLTIILGLLYLGSVVLLQGLFTTLGSQQSPVAIVISTLLIAALFNPLRIRIQDAIDRRFYRQKYDAQKALLTFSKSLRNEVDMDVLEAQLLTTVERTIQPDRVSLLLLEVDIRRDSHA